jgi:hypothetical protein
MSCKSIFVNLGGGGGGSVNTGVLQIAGGVALDSTLRFVEDQAGTDSAAKLSTNTFQVLGNVLGLGAGGGVTMGALNETIGAIWGNVTPATNNFGIGFETNFTYVNAASGIVFLLGGAGGKLDVNANGTSIGGGTQNGALTVKSSGGQITSFRDSSNVEKAYVTSTGALITLSEVRADYIQLNGTIGVFFNGEGSFAAPSDGVFKMANNADTNFDRLQFGGTTASFPSLKRSGTNINVRLSDDTGYGGITAGRSTEKTLEVIEVSGAMGLGFFNTPAINQPTTAIGEATFISSGGGGSQIRTDDTIGGYTMQQVVQALQDLGLLA